MLIFVFFAFTDQQAPVKLHEATVTITTQTPTYWDLATRYAPQSMDKRDWIYQVRQLNSTPAGQLQIGQAVRILKPLQSRSAERLKPLGVFSISAYDICLKCCGKKDGITSTGTHATVGRTIAVDPKIIPYGTRVYIEGIGYRTAEDCGGAIKGNEIDLLMATHGECRGFGIQQIKIWEVN